MKKIINHSKYGQIVRFLVVGASATLVDLIVSFIFLHFVINNENVVTTIGFAVAFIVSYTGHRYFTFQQHGSAIKFFALALCMLALRNLIVVGLVALNIRGMIALIIAIVAVTIITFLVSKFSIFKG